MRVNQTGQELFLGKAMRSLDKSPKLLTQTFESLRPFLIRGLETGKFEVDLPRIEGVMRACVQAIHYKVTGKKGCNWALIFPDFLFAQAPERADWKARMNFLQMWNQIPWVIRVTSEPKIFQYVTADLQGQNLYSLRFYESFRVNAFPLPNAALP